MKVTLGGDRIGSGSKTKVTLHEWKRSSHNLSRAWRSSMQPGIVYPCTITPVLDKDTYDIDVEGLVRTIPTLGPIYGSYKMQIEFGFYPDRLAVGALHGNAVGVGLKMNKVLYPQMVLPLARWQSFENPKSYFFEQGVQFKHASINTSSLLHYLGLCSLPIIDETQESAVVEKNAVPLIAYWDWMKNYHCNKQEENAYVIHGTYEGVYIEGLAVNNTNKPTDHGGKNNPAFNQFILLQKIGVGKGKLSIIGGWKVEAETESRGIKYYGTKKPYEITFGLKPNNGAIQYDIKNIVDFPTMTVDGQNYVLLNEVDQGILNAIGFPNGKSGDVKLWSVECTIKKLTDLPANIQAGFIDSDGNLTMVGVGYTGKDVEGFNKTNKIKMEAFPLSNIDKCREDILSACKVGQNVKIASGNTDATRTISYEPYLSVVNEIKELNQDGTTRDIVPQNTYPLNGLGVKCYLSDRFNNWLRTEWLDGDNGINALTAIDTSQGSFTLDTLILQKKIYQVLNRVAVSDGTYKGWKEANWGYSSMETVESPIFIGGASWNIEFDEVVSTAESGNSPLGSLAGRGNSYKRHNGHIKFKCEESGFIIGFISITPNLDYSEGEKWFYEALKTPEDLHKAGLDGIGFQELPTTEMAGWVTNKNQSAGKQLSWTHYMTETNECHGDFADENKAMYMTLNRRYEESLNVNPDTGVRTLEIGDLTTYIDPSKYNYGFADRSITAQNFWVQIGVKMTSRRVMSANQMPNL